MPDLGSESHRIHSGAQEPGVVAGSRVDGVHRGATRSALDAVRSRADAQVEGRRLGGECRA